MEAIPGSICGRCWVYKRGNAGLLPDAPVEDDNRVHCKEEISMNVYHTAIETNYRMIKGEAITEKERKAIVTEFLEAAGPDVPIGPGSSRGLYPIFYIPPKGIELKSLMSQKPRTVILAGNIYELEILRLLCLLAPEDPRVIFMRDRTFERLKTTCFGWGDDGVGECFDTSLVVLRFLCAAAPDDTGWIKSRIDNYNRHAGEKKRPWFSLWYFWLCLSEMPLELALPEIDKHRAELEKKLRRTYVMHSEQDKELHPVLLCMLRNLMSRLPEYAYLAGQEPCIIGPDGRVGLLV